MSFSEDVAEMLFDIIAEDASGEHHKALAALVLSYKQEQPYAYTTLCSKPFPGRVLRALEEAIDYRRQVGDDN